MRKRPVGLEIRTGARLHFGLLDVQPPFGGAGMMIDEPATRIRFEPAERFAVEGPAKDRVEAVAARLTAHCALTDRPACRVTVLERPAPHSGLGTGTQLAFAVAHGLHRWLTANGAVLSAMDDAAVGEIADRGHRSVVGSLGFFRGGLLVDRDPPQHVAVPAAWRVLLFQPPQPICQVSGAHEQAQFARLPAADPQRQERLVSLLDQQIVPALRDGDFDRFSEAIYQYNHDSGMLFAAVQQGPYNGQSIADLVGLLRRAGIEGVGQSSWGPTVFAFCRSQAAADRLLQHPPLQGLPSRCVRPAQRGNQEVTFPL
jgi:predicted sugar kinase